MKKYVFLNPFMSGMGGGQMYVRNKILYLQKNGWKVDLIYSTSEGLCIKELQVYDYICPELIFPTYYFTKRRKKKVVGLLTSRINDAEYEEIVIESTYIDTATWGEAVAEGIQAKHIINLLQEQNDVVNSGHLDFFIFKHRRRELVGIVDTTLQQMFGAYYPITKEQSYSLPAYCTNVEADIDSPWIDKVDKSRYDFVVGCLSRLEKPFMVPAVTDFCHYAQKYSEKRFLLLLMGGSPNDEVVIPHFVNIVNNLTTNVELIVTGYIYPVPTRLLLKCDAFFTSAGSCWPCMRSGIPTIVYDGNDCMPIGILKRTTESYLFRREDEPVKDLTVLLDQILITKEFPKMPNSFDESLPSFENHISFLWSSAKEKNYYNVNKMHIETLIEFKVYIGILFAGPARYYYLNRRKMLKNNS